MNPNLSVPTDFRGLIGPPPSAEHGFSSSWRSAEHGFSSSWRSAEHGFTLIELMVALLIFGMLSAAGVSLLSFTVRSQAATETSLASLTQLRRAGALFAADLAQAAARTNRDQSGGVRPALIGGGGAEPGPILTMIRRGWENYDGAPRPSLQKVEYLLVEGRLERRAFALVDGAPPLATSTMLDNVRAIRLRYRERQGEWRDRWDPTQLAALPVAVELVVDLAGQGPVRQLFLTGNGW